MDKNVDDNNFRTSAILSESILPKCDTIKYVRNTI